MTATSVAQPLQIGSSTFNVMPPPSITTTNLPTATPNYIYNTALQATGGVQPLNWSLASGTLPAGMTINTAGMIYRNTHHRGHFHFHCQSDGFIGRAEWRALNAANLQPHRGGHPYHPRRLVADWHGGHRLQRHPPLHGGIASLDLEHLQRQSAFGTGVAVKHRE